VQPLGEKRCEIKRDGQDGRLPVTNDKNVIMTIQVNLWTCPPSFTWTWHQISQKLLSLTYHHSHFLVATFDFNSLFTLALGWGGGGAHFFAAWLFYKDSTYCIFFTD